MKKIKYVVLGIIISIFIFLVSNILFAQHYKSSMFQTEEDITYNVNIKTDDILHLAAIENIFKEHAKDNFSIVVHNNSKSNIIEYNFFTTSNYENKIITYQKVDFSKKFEIKTNDKLFFDPLSKDPIIINNIDFKNMSENAIIVLFNFKTENISNTISNLKKDLSLLNLNDLIIFEENNHQNDFNSNNLFLLKEHIYIFLLVILISLLIFKDINNNFKEISLMKLEGNSSVYIYFQYVLLNIIIVVLTMIFSLMLISYLKYNVSIKLVSYYYKHLFLHSIISIVLTLIFTLIAYIVIYKTKIINSIKGYNQLESSIIGLSLLKVLVLLILTFVLTNYIKTLPQSIVGMRNYKESLNKYHNLYLINSSLSVDVNQVIEIEKIKDTLFKNHQGFFTVCLPEGDSDINQDDFSFPIKDYTSIYYIIESNKNQITISPDRVLNDYNFDTFRHYGFDNFQVIKEDLKTNDFIYCTRKRVDLFNEKLYFKNYEVIKIEVENIYNHNLMPNFILFSATDKIKANTIINNIYDNMQEKNQLIIESVEDNLYNSYQLEKQIVIEIIINLLLISTILLILNNELINNYITYDKEENKYLHLIGKSKIYMLRKYLLSNVLIIIVLIVLKLLSYKYGIALNSITMVVFIIMEIISIIYYQKQIEYKKLRGL